MSSTHSPPTYSYRHVGATEVLADHRERLAFEEKGRASERARQLEELRSELNSPPARIRAWEKMHGLRLPTSPTHPILAVIAGATGVPLPALRQEQQARRAQQAASPAVTDDVTGG